MVNIVMRVYTQPRRSIYIYIYIYNIQGGFAQTATASMQLYIVACFTYITQDLVEFEDVFLICSM